jgi:nucleoside 2-deoxyribosyltransferase
MTSAIIPATKQYTYYHAGPLFTLADLTTNIALSTLINQISQNRFQPVLPQDLEPRPIPSQSSATSATTHPSSAPPTPHTIRDTDLQALLTCDLALFIYDGAELDAGTVVEYMYAKAADIPSVILRTDFRGAGDQATLSDDTGKPVDKWNLMSSNWPRTVSVSVDSMVGYKEGLVARPRSASGQTTSPSVLAAAGEEKVPRNFRAAEGLLHATAEKVVKAMEEVVSRPPRLKPELRAAVFEWLAIMPGFKAAGGEGGDADADAVRWAKDLMEAKVANGLL